MVFISPAKAEDAIKERAFLEDPSGNLTFSQASSSPYEVFHGVLAKGYTASVYWVRLIVSPGRARGDDPLVLRIKPNFLDQVTLFDPEYQSYGLQATGDSILFPDHYLSLNLNLIIPHGEVERVIWLRVSTRSTFLFDVSALSTQEAMEQDRIQDMGTAIYVSILTVAILWAVLQWLTFRDPLLIAYILRETLCLVFMFGFLGYARVIWNFGIDVTPGQITDLFIAPYVFASCIFDYLFLKRAGAPSWVVRGLIVAALYLPFYIILLMAGYSREAFSLNMWVVSLEPLYALVAAIYIPNIVQNNGAGILLSRKWVLYLYLSIFVVFSLSSIPALGWAQAGPMVFYGFLFNSLLSGLFIIGALHYQILHIERRRIMAHQQALSEAERRQEKEKFLDMLTHELRTPLSVATMNLGLPQISHEIKRETMQMLEEMTGILERCIEYDRLELGDQKLVNEPLSILQEIYSLTERHNASVEFMIEVRHTADIFLDRALFRTIISNIIDNAVKYKAPGSRVEILAMDELIDLQKGISIKVTNTPGAAGYPDPDQLFQKYYRSPGAHSRSGTGIGLYVCSQLAKSVCGIIDYAREKDRVVFRVWIPN
jgi:signal transduction histidine kinase